MRTVDKKVLHGSAKRDLQDSTCASHSEQLTVHLGLLGLRNALAHHVGLGFRFDRNAFSSAVMKPSTVFLMRQAYARKGVDAVMALHHRQPDAFHIDDLKGLIDPWQCIRS